MKEKLKNFGKALSNLQRLQKSKQSHVTSVILPSHVTLFLFCERCTKFRQTSNFSSRFFSIFFIIIFRIFPVLSNSFYILYFIFFSKIFYIFFYIIYYNFPLFDLFYEFKCSIIIWFGNV